MLDWIAGQAFEALGLFVRLLPLRAALAVGAAIGSLLYCSWRGRRRRVTLENLALAFPEKTEAERRRIAHACCRNLGRTLVEVLRLEDLTVEENRRRVRIEGTEVIRGLAAGGKGGLGLSAHFGNFEYISVCVRRLGLLETHLIGRRIKNPYVDRKLKDLRLRHGVETIGNKGTFDEILGRLARGQGIGVVLDQNAGRKRGIFVDFFGRPASTTPGLALLARRSGAPVLAIFDIRESALGPDGDPAKHVIRVSDPIPWEACEDPDEEVRRNTQRYTRIIEDMVRRYPDQWLWLHDRWRTQPEPKAVGPSGGERAIEPLEIEARA